MRSPKKWLALGLTVAVLAGVSALLLLPGMRLILGGLYRGEQFYQYKPTSYWSKRLRDNPNILHSPMGGPTAVRVRPATYLDDAKAWTGIGKPKYTPADPWLREGDPEALPVLQDLLRDPDPDVRGYAAECLGVPTQYTKRPLRPGSE
jgi:hypothetical protein